jgi:hypothetical protein
MSGNQEEEFRQPEVPNLQMQVMLGEMRRTLRAELEPINERLDRVEAGELLGASNKTSSIGSEVGVLYGGMMRKRRSRRSLMSHI